MDETIAAMQRNFAVLLLLAMPSLAQTPVIRPGEIWPDDRGEHIQAHGGGIIRVGGIYYWFGEDRGKGKDPGKRYVACYSSRDLAHWSFRRQVIQMSDPEGF